MTDATNPSAHRLPIVIVGHVDHGKSTLIGRLLHDTGRLPAGKLEELKAVCSRRGIPLEWSFVLDSFQAERDQAVTIDTTQIWFSTDNRNYVIIDAPGHQEFLKNMVSGAATAEAAILMVDAVEGIRDQTRRHAYLLRLLGQSRIIVAVNKMDLADWSQERFDTVAAEVTSYLTDLGLEPAYVLPISAREGTNVAERPSGAEAPGHWVTGPTLLQALDTLEAPTPVADAPLRFPIQDVYRFDQRRILVGRIESGRLTVGDTVAFSPGGQAATVKSIERFNPRGLSTTAVAGESIGITLDQPAYVERGDVASHQARHPVRANRLQLSLFWLHDRPLLEGDTLTVKIGTRATTVSVESIDRIIDTADLSQRSGQRIERNEMAEVTLSGQHDLVFDDQTPNSALARAVLVRERAIAGGGIVLGGPASIPSSPSADAETTTTNPDDRTLFPAPSAVTSDERAGRNGHSGLVVWLTGLSGAGKSTIAGAVERAMFDSGHAVTVIDGDTVRAGLTSDLGFADDDRRENVRRVAEVARLFADTGQITLVSLISPFNADRDNARAICGTAFREVYVKATVETCEDRDPKGLYARARSGHVDSFTGVTSAYEPPRAPDLVLDTETAAIEDCARGLINQIMDWTSLPDTAKPRRAAGVG